jgi:hypothetical protein
MYRQPLGRGLEGVPFQDRFEAVHRGRILGLRIHNPDNLSYKVNQKKIK